MPIVCDIRGRKAFDNVFQRVDEALDLGPGKTVSLEHLADVRGWVPFEIDPAASEVILLDIAGSDPFSAAFAYTAHLDNANRLARVSAAEFLDLARALPPPPPLAQVFNPGHCGSTLVHHIFNRGGGCASISEPRYLWELQRCPQMTPESRVQHIAATMKFLGSLDRLGDRPTLVIKHFSQAMRDFADWPLAAPDARFVYLHREAISWAGSFFHFLQRTGFPTQPDRDARTLLLNILSGFAANSWLLDHFDPEDEAIELADVLAAAWAQQIFWLRDARAAGMDFAIVDYADVVADPRQGVDRLFAAIGVRPASIDQALTAFGGHSHEGATHFNNASLDSLPEKAEARIRDLLARVGLSPEDKL